MAIWDWEVAQVGYRLQFIIRDKIFHTHSSKKLPISRMPPKVSLILTFHNRSPFLPQALSSVQAQAYPNFELILWNDGSTDDSGEIAAHHAAQDPRIRHFTAKHQETLRPQRRPTRCPSTGPRRLPRLDRQRRKLRTKSPPHPRHPSRHRGHPQRRT
jgi:cellulose synthase/poly-beta-1,6-N-acetylglucosamine synthase-like glycosyltransferase